MKRYLLFLLMACLVSAGTLGQEIRVKLAEGEYAAPDGNLGIGHVESEVFHFRENWTLWRTSAGEYEVEGERTFESPEYVMHMNPFWMHLTHDFRVTQVKEFARLRFERDSGPLVCDLEPARLLCHSGAKDPSNEVDLDLAMDHAYAVMWPISAFSLGSLARETHDRLGQKIAIDIVTVEEVSHSFPAFTVISSGSIQYLGESDSKTGGTGQTSISKVYELDSSPVRRLFIWTTPEGLLLAAQQPNQENSRLQLVSFRKYQDF